MKTRSVVKTVALFVLALFACIMTYTPAQADAPPANSNPFEVNGALVTTSEAPAAVHTQFAVGCPMPSSGQTQPTWLAQDGTTNPACKSGEIVITVTKSTKFYTKDSGGHYVPSTYEQAVPAGNQVRVWGRFARVQFSTYEFVANFVFSPGNDILPVPPEPKPEQPCTGAKSLCLTAYNGQKRFVVDAQVVQYGVQLTNGGVWSDKWGFVVANITDYFSNAEVEAIALSHQNPQTGDPQLPIYVEDGGVPNATITNLGLTKYFVQGSNGQYAPATKSQTVVYGSSLRVVGSYQFLDGLWRFFAKAVFRPAPGVPAFDIIFNSQLTYGYDNVNGSQHFAGASNAGDGKMNPSVVTADLTWVRNQPDSFATGGTWTVTGTWTAARSDNSDALGGNLSGLWYPPASARPGRLDATITVEMANGHYCGFTGAGTVEAGTGLVTKIGGTTPDVVNLPMKIKMTKVSNSTC